MMGLSLTLLGCMAVGFLAINFRRRKLLRRFSFWKEFFTRFKTYVESQDEQKVHEAYAWLIEHSAQMQREMGPLGVVDYSPPGRFDFIRGYQAVINQLLEMENYRGDFGFDREIFQLLVRSYWELLLLYKGELETKIAQLNQEIKNPLIWLREGVRVVLALPIYALNYLGLLSQQRAESVVQSGLFTILSGVGAGLEIVAATVTILAGWEQIVDLVEKMAKFLK